MTLLRRFLLLGIHAYRRLLSPLKTAVFGPAARCRYSPTCSEYALEAVSRHGPFRGAWLALRRVIRCHPWGGCGPDPVPPANDAPDPRGAIAYPPSRPPGTAAALRH